MLNCQRLEPRIRWERRLNEGLSGPGWPMGLSVVDCPGCCN